MRIRRFRPVGIVTLVVFTFFSLRVDLLAESIPPQGTDQPENQKEISTAGQFQKFLAATQKLLEEIENLLESGEDISAKLVQLTDNETNLNQLAEKLRSEFNDIRAKLEAEDSPPEILQLHDEFVQKFEATLDTLLGNIGQIETAENDDLKGKIKEAKDHLGANLPKKKSTAPSKSVRRLKKIKQAAKQVSEALLDQQPDDTYMAGNPPVGSQSSPGLLSWIGNLFCSVVEAAELEYPEYLGETVEVQFTQEIEDLASLLDNSPLKIYRYVRNSLQYEPYYGSLKGAVGTLHNQAGNDFDHASLLIALLRTSGIPARYVYGKVEIPMEKAKLWVGIDNPWRVGDLLVTYGIPAVTIVKGGQPSAVQIEHCWVEAYVDYVPSGGGINQGGDTWIPLDPSFKLKEEYFETVDISEEVPFDTSGYLGELQARDAVGFYMRQLRSYLAANMPDKNLAEVGRAGLITAEETETMPASLPYKKILRIATYAEIPSAKRYQVKVTVPGDGFLTDDLVYQASLPAINGKRLTLSYVGNQSPYSNPVYTVLLQPTIKLDGIEQVTGDPVGAGQDQQLVIDMIMPNQGAERIQNDIIAGGFYALVTTWPSSTGQAVTEMGKRLNQNITDLGDAFLGADGFVKEDLAGDFLHLIGKSWFTQVGLAKELAASFMHLPMFQDIGYASISVEVEIEYLFGMPYTMTLSGLMIDADRNVSAIMPKAGEEWKTKEYMTLTGYASSALEHFIWEQKYEPGAISAVKAIQIANENNIPVHDIDASNVSLIDSLSISENVKQEMRNAINAGKVVKTPAQNITHAGWTGVGYIVSDPVTGEGRYEIEQLSGGFYWTGGPPSAAEMLFAFAGRERYYHLTDTAAAAGGLHNGHVRNIAYSMTALGYNTRYGTPWNLAHLRFEMIRAPYTLFYFIGHGTEFYASGTVELSGRALLTRATGRKDEQGIPIDDPWEWLVSSPAFEDEVPGTGMAVPSLMQNNPWKVVFLNACRPTFRKDMATAFGIDTSDVHHQAYFGPDTDVNWGGAMDLAERIWEHLADNPGATFYDAVDSESVPNSAYRPPYGTWFDPPAPYWDFGLVPGMDP